MGDVRPGREHRKSTVRKEGAKEGGREHLGGYSSSHAPKPAAETKAAAAAPAAAPVALQRRGPSSVGISLPEEPPEAPVCPMKEPRVIPAQSVLSVRAEWDRKLACELAVRNAHFKLSQLQGDLRHRIADLESQQLEALQTRGTRASEDLDQQVQDGYERIERIKKLTAKLQGREPHAFTDVLVTMLQTLDEATLADDAVLRQCDVARQETFDLKEVAARPVHTLKVKATVRCMCRDPELPEQVYLGCEDGTVKVWDLQTLRQVRTYETGVYPIHRVLVARLQNRKRLIAAGRDKTVRIWDVARHECTHIFVDHAGCVTGLHAHDDTLYTSAYDRTVRHWDLRRGRCGGLVLQATSPVHCSAFLDFAGQVFFATGTRAGTVELYPWVGSGHSVLETERMQFPGHSSAVLCLLQHTDFLFSGSEDRTVVQWDLREGAKAREYRRHVDSVVDMKATADNLLFTASQDALIIVWNITNGTFIRELHHHYHWVSCLELLMVPHVADPEEDAPGPAAAAAPSPAPAALAPAPADVTCGVVPLPEVSDIAVQEVEDTAASAGAADGGEGVGGQAPAAEAACPYLVSGSVDKTIVLWALSA